MPHARTVGVESDRQYGVAVLTELVREMNRRAGVMKQSGVTKLSDLRGVRRDVAMPRLVTVIDEFHVLFQGNDETAKRAAALLEEVARKGRSYGVHLILASQSLSGIEALYTKGQSVFGQFGLRVALSGGGGVLATGNAAADALPIGQAIVNDAAGVPAGNRGSGSRTRTPSRSPGCGTGSGSGGSAGSTPPGVFVGYAEYAIDDDPTYRRLTPGARRRSALLGRAVDVGLPAAGFVLDSTPGRHLAVLGTSTVGADLLHAAALSLAQQYERTHFASACSAIEYSSSAAMLHRHLAPLAADMTATLSLIDELETALAAGSNAQRISMLSRITDLFVEGASRYSPNQINLFDEVIGKLSNAIEAKARAKLASRLAPVPNSPAGVIRLWRSTTTSRWRGRC